MENRLITHYLNYGISNLLLKIINSNKKFPNLIINWRPFYDILQEVYLEQNDLTFTTKSRDSTNLFNMI
jgi:hypothetical protein